MKSLQNNIINEFKGKTILITGGTGSIGLGIVKQLVNCKPKAIRIFANDADMEYLQKKIKNL